MWDGLCNRTNVNHAIWRNATRTQHHLCDSLTKDAYPESDHEETSDKLRLRHSLQNIWPVSFTSAKVMTFQSRKNWGTVSDEGNWSDTIVTCNARFWTGSFCGKWHLGDTWQNLNEIWGLEVLMSCIDVNFLISWFYCSYIRECTCL